MSTQTLALIDSGAEFSEPDRTYRFKLWRRWADGPRLTVIGLNPSTADAVQDDPTIRRCIGYARTWGFGGLTMLNIWALRSTDPKALRTTPRDGAIEQWNYQVIVQEAISAQSNGGAILAAWGNHGSYAAMGATIWLLLGQLQVGVACLGRTETGEPRHPLYVRADARPIAYVGDGGVLVTKQAS